MTEPSARDQVTRHLAAIGEEGPGAEQRLLPLVYDELRSLAAHLFRQQQGHHTLQPTALVHEAWLRLVGGDSYEDRQHFFRVAAMAMRQLLVDHARARRAEKRGGDRQRVLLEDAEGEASRELDLVALDDALSELARLDERQARVVELRFLAGMSVPETAEALGVSERTVYLDWKMARVWLEQQLG